MTEFERLDTKLDKLTDAVADVKVSVGRQTVELQALVKHMDTQNHRVDKLETWRGEQDVKQAKAEGAHWLSWKLVGLAALLLPGSADGLTQAVQYLMKAAG